MRFAWLLLWPAILLAQAAEETVPTALVEIEFTAERIAIGEVKKIRAPLRRYLGVAQLQPVFFEVVDGDGNVVYAAEVPYPSPGRAPQGDDKAVRARIARIRVPLLEGARTLVVYERVSEDVETGRRECARVAL